MSGLALAQGVGVACGFFLPAWGIAPAIFLSILALALLIKAKAAPAAACLPIIFCIGWISLLPWTGPPNPDGHISTYADAGPAAITGTIVERPDQFRDRTRFVLRVSDVNSSGPLKGRIRTTVRPPVPELIKGAKVHFRSDIRSFRNFSNPGGFDYVRYMRFKNIFGSAYVRGKDKLEILEAPGGFFTRTEKSLGRLIEESAPESSRPLLRALLLGDKKAVDQDARDLFADAGIAHVLAISGLHIGMVAVFALFLFKWILSRSERLLLSGRLFQISAILTMAPVLFYGMLTGMAPSTQRAVIMVGVFLMAYVFNRDYDSLNTLGAAAVLILLWNPPALFDVGFQLSFTAVFCILYGLKKIPFRTIPITLGEKLQRRGLIYLLIPIVAHLGAAPIVLHYFDRISLVGPLANLIVVPLIGFAVLPLALMAGLIHPILPWLSGFMIAAAGHLLQFVLSLSQWLASVPFASVMPIKPNALEMALYYAALFALINVKKKWSAALLAVCLIGGLADAGYWMHQRFGREDLQVTFLDVGQGSAVLVEFPGGPCMLIDGGGLSASSSFDTGRMIVAPYLWQQKIHTIEYLVLTHPQHDHAGGLGYMAERFRVREFWSNGQPAPIHAYEHLTAACERKDVLRPSLKELHKPRVIRGVTARVLHPAPGFEAGLGGDVQLNENSLVLKLSRGDKSVLFTGDIGEQGENLLLKRWPPEILQSTLLAAPHHGSRTSSTQAFVEAVRPEHVVFTTGYRNWYGFPHEEVVRRYEKVGAKMYNTGTQGACTFSAEGEDWAGKASINLSLQ
ncbi:competence protein ComEC [Desulfatibacillum alkenivorans DSM 16219]|jgi:competence protein ComEC|uniref:Competence protein ComEC n=2 Tax=Desulfatibacillum alkenivorans TaxID=259354 RepID=A0A1M6GV15_9BACT|nr:competence protein ComEC [Desulfatibacillum alkenivorans DSM 16219]